jgi:hypothetical protein
MTSQVPPIITVLPLTTPLTDNPTSGETDQTILISSARLHELESLEKNLPKMIEEAILENKKRNLKLLHEKDKSNPESVNLRVKRYALRHKETLTARRRSKREQIRKLLGDNGSSPLSSLSLRTTPEITTAPASSATNMFLLSSVITVRFDD